MTIPVSDRNEYAVSSLGVETFPQGIIVKNSLWFLQISYKRLILKNYGGLYFVFDSILVSKYKLTPALNNNLTINTDRMWAWVISPDGNLSLYEFEPFDFLAPEITYSKLNIDSNVNSISISVVENAPIRIVSLYNNGSCKSVNYLNIRDSAPPITGNLNWSASRLSEFSNFVSQNDSKLDLTYLDVASPPNVYLDSYLVETPLNFSAFRVGDTNEVDLSWDASVTADLYLIQRDTDSLFPSPEEYQTGLLSYVDFVPTAGTYYYRIRALNSGLLLQSPWSTTEIITAILDADFEANPLSGLVGENISFSDLSTPTGTITYWEWDFGDGSPHSNLQNPVHSYSNPGIYQVSLYVESGSFSDTEIKPDYITITPSLDADFSGDPLSGDANLAVLFTDESYGVPISWDWDFGDGSPHSIEKNPIHVYTTAGLFTVSLTVSDGSSTSTETKTNYITVLMAADFVAQPLIGPANLSVHFTDTTLGNPDTWEWDFHDGTDISTEQNPTHVFRTPGYHTVTLIARNSTTGAEDTETKTDFILVYTNADFYGEPRRGDASLTVQFVDISTGFPDSWYWDFGDGSFSEDQNPLHFYSSPGVYTVTLTVSSAFNSDSETKERYVIISGIATPDIAPEPDILMYMRGQVSSYTKNSGIRIEFNNRNS